MTRVMLSKWWKTETKREFADILREAAERLERPDPSVELAKARVEIEDLKQKLTDALVLLKTLRRIVRKIQGESPFHNDIEAMEATQAECDSWLKSTFPGEL